MKRYSKSILPLIILLPMSLVSTAETQQKPMAPMGEMKMKPGMDMPQGMGMGMGMMGNMSEEQKEQHLRSMQEHMLTMHDLSNQILAETDAVKKEQLKNQQLQLMKAHHAQMMGHRKQKMMSHQQKMQTETTDKK